DETLDKPRDIAVRYHHALRKFAEQDAFFRPVELRHQVEARQRGVELFAQPLADLSLDEIGAGQEAQPQAQFAAMVMWILAKRIFGIDMIADIRNFVVVHTSPPAAALACPVIAEAPLPAKHEVA